MSETEVGPVFCACLEGASCTAPHAEVAAGGGVAEGGGGGGGAAVGGGGGAWAGAVLALLALLAAVLAALYLLHKRRQSVSITKTPIVLIHMYIHTYMTFIENISWISN